MSPAAGAGGARSLQFVSDQELEGAVKADVRQRRAIRSLILEQRRPKPQKAKVGIVGCRAGETTKRGLAVEQLLGIVGQIARESRDLGVAVKCLAIGHLA